MSRLKKTLLIIFGTLFLLVVLVIAFISPIAKYLIEKYDEKFTGRQITLNWAYVNPFTGYVHLDDVKIFEYKSDTVFFSASGITANLEMHKLISKTYEITELTLTNPKGYVIQNRKDFNFKDLITKFSPKDTIPKPKKAPLKFSLLNIKIENGEFHYFAKSIPVIYFIKNVNIESTGFRWDADTIASKFALLSGTGSGDVKGNITINTKSNDYKLAVDIHKFDLDIINQYLKELINYGTFKATLDADLKSTGNFKDKQKVTNSGHIMITDFHFGKNPKEDFASIDKLIISIHKLSPAKHIYYYDSLSITHPYFKYERYDHLDNVQTMFGKKGANVKAANADATKFNLIIELAKYIRAISKNFLNSPYRVDRLAIYNADFRFNDFSTNEEFSAALNPLTFTADSISKNNKRLKFVLNSGIKPYGNLAATLSINPQDSTDFDITCRLQKIPITMFNPYVISFTSFPLDRGTLEFNAKWDVNNGIIQSKNHLVIVDPRTTKKIKNKDNKWIPVPLIMAFIKERGNVIDYEIPVTGNLKDPKFHFKDVIFDLIDNIFVKPPTLPYRLEVKSTETEIEKSLAIKWKTRNVVLESKQEKFIGKIVDFLKDNPQAFIDVYPQHFTKKEKEYILFYEAKKKYYLVCNHKTYQSYNEDDSETVVKMSIKDSSFVKYLNKNLKGTPNVFTIQEKCSLLVDSNIINNKYAALNKEREQIFILFFKDKKVDNQVRFAAAQDVIPYNGFSFYKIKYKGEFPTSLLEA
ncbi:MAG: DUF748 domain-containing protein, partial [Bacteroidia bacterium]